MTLEYYFTIGSASPGCAHLLDFDQSLILKFRGPSEKLEANIRMQAANTGGGCRWSLLGVDQRRSH